MYRKSVEGTIEWIDIKQNIGNRNVKKIIRIFGIPIITYIEKTNNRMKPDSKKEGIGFINKKAI